MKLMKLMKLRQQQHTSMSGCRLKKVLGYPMLVFFALMANTVTAQNGGFVYAITNFNTTGSGWDALRKLDLKTGEFSPVLLNGSDAKLETYDALTKKICNTVFTDVSSEKNINTPFSTGVAAAAFDQRNNRLYFTPIAIDQLRYIDLNSMKLYYVMDQSLRASKSELKNEGEIITRMTVATNGYGYAISNDGNSFVRFKTGENTKIEQLGPLKDDPENNGISIHDYCNSWGGDMVADDDGNLYILSARNTVFKIDTETRSAKFVNVVKGLPRGFTIDGAVVTSEGKLLVSSTRNSNDYYLIDTKHWAATPYKAKGGIFRSSDLANGNYLHSASKSLFVSNASDGKISLYPNPVKGKKFTLQFEKIIPGNYIVQMYNIKGNIVMRQNVKVEAEEQAVTVAIASAAPMNLYVVELTNADGTVVFTQKILVQ